MAPNTRNKSDIIAVLVNAQAPQNGSVVNFFPADCGQNSPVLGFYHASNAN